ncbi:hypothetical protein E4U21_003036 [Claviceps maximensis]|nr:hypothetical protein E4U21_003036 [Claviceps maximensis]
MVALVDVSEAARERETFRYDPSLARRTVCHSQNNPLLASRLRSAPDPALTAFAQLAVLRLKTSRAFISLFDASSQHFIAEATPDLGLQPECPAGNNLLWLSNTTIPRTYGICELVLTANVAPIEVAKSENEDETLPVTIINDLASDPRSADRPCMISEWSKCRFYAAVPIRTNHRINIGVFCIADEESRAGLASDEVRFMVELSKVIMGHLELKRATNSQERTERMVRGISSFIDGSTDLTKNKFDTLSLNDNTREKRPESDPQAYSLDSRELQAIPAADAEETKDAADQDIIELPKRGEISDPQICAPTRPYASTEECAGEDNVAIRARRIYTKAANALCSSLNVEGLIFLDANATTFGGADAEDFRNASAASSSSLASLLSSSATSSSDEHSASGCRKEGCRNCNYSSEPFAPVLGFSSTPPSAIQDDPASHQSPKLPQRFLRKLLRRYPNGTIFNFNQSGTVQSSDWSSDETSADQGISAVLHKSHPRCASANRSRMKKSEQEMLMNLLSGARCIAFAPVWDPSTQRWSAGTFAYTKASSRIFSTKVELSYLIAFGTIVMSEVSRLKATLTQKSRMDMLSSLSHELRSPLHGVVLGVEMLHDSALDRVQKDVVRTMETCSRTLLDTVDHLLHWTKINNFNTKGLPRHKRASGDYHSKGDLRVGRITCNSAEAGMMSITADVAVDELAEEVIESVFAGHTYQKLIAPYAAKMSSSVEPNWTALRRLDCMHAAMDHVPVDSRPSGVVVSLYVEPHADWVFHTQAGALRRVIMNLLGNSLKYTARGFIQVTLSQKSTGLPCSARIRARRDLRAVCLTVSDSGKGISAEYLKSHLFVPFSQEDRLSPGVGLGLSLVKKIVSRLGGQIKVQSSLGRGTAISVELPLEVAAPSVPSVPPSPFMSPYKTGDLEPEAGPDPADTCNFKRHVEMLSGLNVHVAGFSTHDESVSETEHLGIPGIGKPFDQRATLVAICRDWLHMTVLDASADGNVLTTKADLVICTAASLDLMQREYRETMKLTPMVVICSSVTVARTVESRYKDCSLDAVIEYSFQPVGPRKLARVLASSLQRWNERMSRRTTAELTQSDMMRQQWLSIDAMLTSGQSPGVESAYDESPFDEAPPGKADAPTSPLSSSGSSTSCQETFDWKPTKASSSASPPPASTLLSPPPRDRFLIVDDNPINLKILSSCMKKMGHLHDAVRNGREAVDAFILGAGAYKCILMDLSMPVMTGFEASCLIRQQEKKEKLEPCTIVALTALASAEAQQEAFTCGIDLFLTKPVRFEELSHILKSRGLT